MENCVQICDENGKQIENGEDISDVIDKQIKFSDGNDKQMENNEGTSDVNDKQCDENNEQTGYENDKQIENDENKEYIKTFDNFSGIDLEIVLSDIWDENDTAKVRNEQFKDGNEHISYENAKQTQKNDKSKNYIISFENAIDNDSEIMFCAINFESKKIKYDEQNNKQIDNDEKKSYIKSFENIIDSESIFNEVSESDDQDKDYVPENEKDYVSDSEEDSGEVATNVDLGHFLQAVQDEIEHQI